MNRKLFKLLTVLMTAISIALGLLWWLMAWQMGVLAALTASGHVVFIAGFGMIQLLGWAVAVLLIWRSMRIEEDPPYLIVLAVSGGIFLGNIVWYLTPILGAPLILGMAVVGLVSLFWRHKRSIPA